MSSARVDFFGADHPGSIDYLGRLRSTNGDDERASYGQALPAKHDPTPCFRRFRMQTDKGELLKNAVFCATIGIPCCHAFTPLNNPSVCGSLRPMLYGIRSWHGPCVAHSGLTNFRIQKGKKKGDLLVYPWKLQRYSIRDASSSWRRIETERSNRLRGVSNLKVLDRTAEAVHTAQVAKLV